MIRIYIYIQPARLAISAATSKRTVFCTSEASKATSKASNLETRELCFGD